MTVAELLDYAKALVPPAAIGFIFYRIIRSMLEADRRERRALAQWGAQQRAEAEPNTAPHSAAGNGAPEASAPDEP